MTTASGTTENLWKRFTEQHFTHNVSTAPKYNFWLIIGFPAKNFSEHLEHHHLAPMLVPASGIGNIVGIASNKADATAIMKADSDRVHLLYKIKFQGQDSWRDLLTFLAENNMLEADSS